MDCAVAPAVMVHPGQNDGESVFKRCAVYCIPVGELPSYLYQLKVALYEVLLRNVRV